MLKRLYILSLFYIIALSTYAQKTQTISYSEILKNGDSLLKSRQLGLQLTILKDAETGKIIYEEIHSPKTDTAGIYHIEIGSGKQVTGIFDSIIWSEGIFFIRTAIDTGGSTNYKRVRNMLMRIPTELTNDHMQGTEASSATPAWGSVQYINNRNRRPKKVTVDLTTSYINTSYPGDAYPVYRHYEWCDVDRDGSGNSFTISYSDNTTNAFEEHTEKLGEVKLYSIPFQELFISSTNTNISITLTEPVPVTDHGRTFEIKGPWKLIYFIEW